MEKGWKEAVDGVRKIEVRHTRPAVVEDDSLDQCQRHVVYALIHDPFPWTVAELQREMSLWSLHPACRAGSRARAGERD